MQIQLPDFSKASILVIGDIMLDRYWFGDAARISPEAPVPVVNIKQTDERPGGAGNVALNGGMGVISTAHPGYRAVDFYKDTLTANLIELNVEIQKAKEIAKGKGMVAVNVMVAITDYAKMVEQSIASGVDAIISGAGLPMNLPKYVENTKIKIAPIVSSSKAARLILKT